MLVVETLYFYGWANRFVVVNVMIFTSASIGFLDRSKKKEFFVLGLAHFCGWIKNFEVDQEMLVAHLNCLPFAVKSFMIDPEIVPNFCGLIIDFVVDQKCWW